MEEGVVGGVKQFGFVGLIASTTQSVPPDRRRSLRDPCSAKLLILVRLFVGAQQTAAAYSFPLALIRGRKFG
eukprot:scaffold1466_cov385-Prasinococcus_capsulatus_cf.AAC.24